MSTPDRPLGEIVAPKSVRRPVHLVDQHLSGRFVTLTGLSREHAPGLFSQLGGTENAWIWDYIPDGPYLDIDSLSRALAAKEASADPVFYAILSNKTQEVVGYISLMRIDSANRCIEVGHVIFSPRLQKTPGATESVYLLARLALEDLGYRRCEWKCNSLNMPSRRAAERLGFQYEGTFRKHIIARGRNRDTTWFSMLDDEWPACKAAFEAWLSPREF